MGEYSIVVCKGCGKKFRVYTYEYYPGDSRYCRECNEMSAFWDEEKEITKEDRETD